MASFDLRDLDVPDLPSPIDDFTRFEDEARETINQLELPGVDGGRAARNLRVLKAYHEFKMQQAVNHWSIVRLERVERQDAALGWIRVAGVGIALLALLTGLVAIILGDADPMLAVPLAAVFGGGATPEVIHRWVRSSGSSGCRPGDPGTVNHD